MSVLSSPCNRGDVFLRAYLLCAKNQTGSRTNAHCFQVIRTLGKKVALSLSCLVSLNFKRYEETCLNQERDKNELPSVKTS